jgi:hypothetical protein
LDARERFPLLAMALQRAKAKAGSTRFDDQLAAALDYIDQLEDALAVAKVVLDDQVDTIVAMGAGFDEAKVALTEAKAAVRDARIREIERANPGIDLDSVRRLMDSHLEDREGG